MSDEAEICRYQLTLSLLPGGPGMFPLPSIVESRMTVAFAGDGIHVERATRLVPARESRPSTLAAAERLIDLVADGVAQARLANPDAEALRGRIARAVARELREGYPELDVDEFMRLCAVDQPAEPLGGSPTSYVVTFDSLGAEPPPTRDDVTRALRGVLDDERRAFARTQLRVQRG